MNSLIIIITLKKQSLYVQQILTDFTTTSIGTLSVEICTKAISKDPTTSEACR